jgi:hypothetical protein
LPSQESEEKQILCIAYENKTKASWASTLPHWTTYLYSNWTNKNPISYTIVFLIA